jgi:hypothetical protein
MAMSSSESTLRGDASLTSVNSTSVNAQLANISQGIAISLKPCLEKEKNNYKTINAFFVKAMSPRGYIPGLNFC